MVTFQIPTQQSEGRRSSLRSQASVRPAFQRSSHVVNGFKKFWNSKAGVGHGYNLPELVIIPCTVYTSSLDRRET